MCLCFVFTLKSKLDFHAFTYRIIIFHGSRCTRDHVFTSIFSVFHVSRFRKKVIHVSRLDPFQTHLEELQIYLYNQRPLYFKYIAEFHSIFSVYYNYTSVFSDLFRSILNLHRHFEYVNKLSNEKFLDIRELDENFLTYYKIPRYIKW